MAKLPAPEQKGQTFADEVRASEPLFIAAAVKEFEKHARAELRKRMEDAFEKQVAAAVAEFKKRMAIEYPRLRGYAMEQGTSGISLSIVANFDFAPRTRSVELVTRPEFTPPPVTSKIKC